MRRRYLARCTFTFGARDVRGLMTQVGQRTRLTILESTNFSVAFSPLIHFEDCSAEHSFQL